MRTHSWCSQNITSCLHPAVTLSQLGLSSGSKFTPATSAEIICRVQGAVPPEGCDAPQAIHPAYLEPAESSLRFDALRQNRQLCRGCCSRRGKRATAFGIISTEGIRKEGGCFACPISGESTYFQDEWWDIYGFCSSDGWSTPVLYILYRSRKRAPVVLVTPAVIARPFCLHHLV